MLQSIRSRTKNLLIISDLHLGEGLRLGAQGVSADDERLRRLERELSAFLIHYTAERIEGRPWRLVVNGDMVDFMSILLYPQPVAQLPPPWRVASALRRGDPWGEEEVFGMGFGAEPSRLKLERVLDHHAAVFGLLARFIAAGNDLVIVLGNHDMEFAHEEVQRAFVRRLCLLGRDRRIARRVHFCPWFYYEPDLIYIEHGHQYDEYCSFDYQLCPAPSRGGMALSLAHLGMRFFGNLVPGYDQRTAERWGALDYLRWGVSLGLGSLVWLAYLYGLLVWKVLSIGMLISRSGEEALRRARHRAQLRALAQTLRIQEEKLWQLDALRVPPALRRLGRALTALFLDRLILGVCTVLLLAVALPLSPGPWKMASAAAIVGAAGAAYLALRRVRGQGSPHALRRVTRAIYQIVRAPLIVLGHSHEPERIALGEGAVYYNTGTWMDGGGSHVGTHLVVLPTEEAPRAELRRWQNGTVVKLDL
ncbi:MAG: metallophosphoesterase [Myxococcales bacterium]|nr:metallophosphoesterase [Myxococcota bacterium]MDW8284382.1 metallophosphoesterase [Myxococcales bacterium]